MATFSPYYVEVPGRFRFKVDENSYTEFSRKETSKPPCHEFMKKLQSSAKATTPFSANTTHAAQGSESELNDLPSLTYNSPCPPYQGKTLKSGDISPSSTELGEKGEIVINEQNSPSYRTNVFRGVLVKSDTCSAKLNEVIFPTYTSPSRCKTPSDTATISTRCSLDTEPDDEKVLLSRPFEKGDLAHRPRVLKKIPQPQLKGQSEVKNPRPKKMEKIYSSNVVYETTTKASAIEFCTGTKKVLWQDPEVSGEYVSFLPSMTETEDKDEIFRRQGVVRGYSKRTLPHYKVAVKAAVMERKNDQAWWKVFG